MDIVRVLDQFNNTVTNYTGTVQFTSSDGQALLPGNYTFVAGDNGVHTFSNGVTLKTAGSQTVTATDGGGHTGSATVNVTFASGGATRSEEHTSELQSHLNLVCRLLL